ncbi:hypothetical protein [Streptomyces sp. TLI_171]|uniref:hypothetical protein n=1 Tax=Streptomyces sp. TLI_171 TaxID=1938859 RepID=UPI000C69804C|nr:hypothetical protein [Streptomyces sp. TLI_171]RKE05152.1 hypothetical protein BX266_7415 [Streptomyces sp. TLI_171]
MEYGKVRASAAAIGAVLLLGVTGCTDSGGGNGGEAKAVDSKAALPSQPLPEPPRAPEQSPFASPPSKQPTALPTPSALPSAEAEREFLAVVRIAFADANPEFKDVPDERLLALGNGLCSILRAGQPMLNAENWLATQGYRDSNSASALLLAAAGSERSLCADESVRVKQELLGMKPHS